MTRSSTDNQHAFRRGEFEVTPQGVHYYLTKLLLNPHETRAIDIRKLRDAQVEDFRGNKIPADATDGSVNWIRLDNVAVSGRMVVLRRHGGVASGYDCESCSLRSEAPNQVTPRRAETLISVGGGIMLGGL